jgi:hypothetical protein
MAPKQRNVLAEGGGRAGEREELLQRGIEEFSVEPLRLKR